MPPLAVRLNRSLCNRKYVGTGAPVTGQTRLLASRVCATDNEVEWNRDNTPLYESIGALFFEQEGEII